MHVDKSLLCISKKCLICVLVIVFGYTIFVAYSKQMSLIRQCWIKNPITFSNYSLHSHIPMCGIKILNKKNSQVN